MFFNPPATKRITSFATTIGSLAEMGITIFVPENAANKTSDISIYPCFSGPFELPDQYESASPAYLIQHKLDFEKDLTIKMHHHACLLSEEDCKDMVFLSASSTPEYRRSGPTYVFKEIHGVKGIFRPGDQIGETSLRHFCLKKIGRKRPRGIH